jgi:hypothetical protein
MLPVACLAASLLACAYSPNDPGYSGVPIPLGIAADANAPPPSNANGDGSADASATPDTSAPPDDAAIPPGRPDAQPAQCTLTIGDPDPSCNACLAQSCCAVDNTCGQDQNCIAMIECLDQCLAPDSGADGGADADPLNPNVCMSQCSTQFPTGAAEFNALNNCVETECPGSC